MIVLPFDATNIAKLVATTTCHMHATFIFFNDHLALITFFEQQSFLQKLDSILFALSCMFIKKAFLTKFLIAYYTYYWPLINKHIAEA
jgi:hypothetical protein